MLKEKVKAVLNSLDNKADVFFADEGDLFQQFFNTDFDSNNIPGWTFTGDWQHLENAYGQTKPNSMHQIYQYTENDESVYIKFSGWWSSYEGAEYGSWEFVVPVKETITVWKDDVS